MRFCNPVIKFRRHGKRTWIGSVGCQMFGVSEEGTEVFVVLLGGTAKYKDVD